jgi:hypothetical protein
VPGASSQMRGTSSVIGQMNELRISVVIRPWSETGLGIRIPAISASGRTRGQRRTRSHRIEDVRSGKALTLRRWTFELALEKNDSKNIPDFV